MKEKRLFLAWFGDEHEVLEATRAAREAGFRIHDVYTPYAVHGMDEAMGLRPSRLTFACFAFGLTGLGLALLFQHWTSAVDWPIIVGGKPLSSVPAFIPVTFELTVLFAGLGTVATLFARAWLVPRPSPKFMPEGVTKDKFVLALTAAGDVFDGEQLQSLCEKHGAEKTEFREVRP